MRNLKESQTLELKRMLTVNLKKEIVAFANTNGGEIYIGIDDDGYIFGLDNAKKDLESISNMIHNGIKPDISPFTSVDIIRIEGKEVIKLNVFKGEKAPYYISNKGMKPSGVYIRHGSISTQAGDEYIRKMIRDTEKMDYETIVSNNQELTFSQAEYTFKEKSIPFKMEQKKSLELLNSIGEYKNLALWLSDQCKTSIKCARYLGNTKETFTDRKEFSGSLFKQLEDVFDYLMHNHNSVSSIIEGLYRKDKYEYPYVAIREALLNCIVHKDYDFNSNTSIHIFDDRIEFVNVGALMYGVSMESVLSGISVTRNTKLANVFYRLDLIESFGTGIGRIVGGYKLSLKKPTFISRDQVFLVTLPNMKYQENIIKEEVFINQWGRQLEEEIVINYIKKNKYINRQTVEDIVGISKTAAINLINKLIAENHIYTYGKGRATKYYLK